MIILGITGSLGMGKSVAASMLRTMGMPVHDADRAAHRALAPGGAGEAAVHARFGTTDRKALRAALGSDDEKWRALEHILHPLVREAEDKFLCRVRSLGGKIAALDIPLLFETGAQKRVDYTLCVTAPSFLQWQRARKRGMTRDDFRVRLSRQWPDAQKRAAADFIVQTGLGRAYTYKQLRHIIRELQGREPCSRSGRCFSKTTMAVRSR